MLESSPDVNFTNRRHMRNKNGQNTTDMNLTKAIDGRQDVRRKSIDDYEDLLDTIERENEGSSRAGMPAMSNDMPLD